MITIHILANISRSKVKQTTKFAQLIEYKVRYFFLINHAQNFVEKLVPDPFIKRIKIDHISGSTV